MDIIATIGSTCTREMMEALSARLAASGVSYLRFNLSKYSDQEGLDKIVENILHIKNKYPFKIMLDLPVPSRKPRLYIKGKASLQAKKGERFDIAFKDFTDLDIIRLDTEHNVNLQEGDCLFYSDRDSEWVVTHACESKITVEVMDDCTIHNTKSLCFGQTVQNEKRDLYLNAVKYVQPYSVALSFVENAKDVKEVANIIGSGIKIVSKVETEAAVINIASIANCSEIMVGRGDLTMYADYTKLYNLQKDIATAMLNSGTNMYFATGVLSSLQHSSSPTVAEITDISHIASYNPAGVVLNYGVVIDNIEKAASIIAKVVKYQHG